MRQLLHFRRCFPLVLLALELTQSWGLGSETPLNTKLDILYKTTAEGALNLDLYYPGANGSGPYPVVIYTHGGGWSAGSKKAATNASMGKVLSGLTAQGFCVVAVDYRLYTKGGQVTIKDCVTDCKDAVRYLAMNHEIQGDKDTTIPVHHARYMMVRAEAIHAPVEIVVFKNAGHNWRSVGGDIRPSREKIIEKSVAYLKQHLDRVSKH